MNFHQWLGSEGLVCFIVSFRAKKSDGASTYALILLERLGGVMGPRTGGGTSQSLVLSGLILRRIFDRNQQEFTAADPKTIPTIAVVEEAQSVLNENAPAAQPYVAWVKEGRKYDLGALLITQQPGKRVC